MTKVLLVEDDEALARGLDWVLSDAEYEVHRLRSTDDIDAAVADGRPQVVTFNTEMAPPEKLGEIERMRAEYKFARIIDLHTHASRRPGEGTGADGYLHKPFGADDLLTLVEEMAADSVEHAPDETAPAI